MDNPETRSGVPAVTHKEAAVHQPPVSETPQRHPIEMDDSKAVVHYANFCRLSGMPEELLIDFGLNPQPMAAAANPILVNAKVVTGWQTAKRLLQVLSLTVERHEAAFGVLETDVAKRARSIQ